MPPWASAVFFSAVVKNGGIDAILSDGQVSLQCSENQPVWISVVAEFLRDSEKRSMMTWTTTKFLCLHGSENWWVSQSMW